MRFLFSEWMDLSPTNSQQKMFVKIRRPFLVEVEGIQEERLRIREDNVGVFSRLVVTVKFLLLPQNWLSNS